MIGSHNSWSFAPTKWYIPAFVCRCQKWNIQKQYEHGVRVFDLRLRMSPDDHWGVAHGAAFFDCDFKKDLKYLNQKKDAYVRVILEYNSKPKKNYDYLILDFKGTCGFLENYYKNIRFFGGRMKYSWEKLYTFNPINEIELLDKYSSTTSWFNSDNYFLKIIDDWWPWLYARFHNKKNYEKWLKSDRRKCLFIDFVNLVL